MDQRGGAPHGSRRRARAPGGVRTPAERRAEVDGRAGSEREALLRVAAAAAGAHRLDEVLELAAEEALRAVGAASLSIGRWERAHGWLRTLINVGQLGPGENRFPEQEVYPIAEHPQLERMLRNGEPYFNAVDDPGTDPSAAAVLRRLEKASDVGVPIVTEGDSWGEIWASTAIGEPRFRGSDVRFLQAIAGQLAVAIERAELFSRVSRLAYEDALTGLANRRALEERLDRAVARAQAGGPQLGLLLCDVDNLKAVNDSEGHDSGDRLICRVAEALVAASAELPGALVARLAGDEFCVLLEGGDLEAARAVAETALASLAEQRGPRISISCGAAAWGPAVQTPEQLLRAADAGQYAAKRRGGNQLCTAMAGIPEPSGSRRRSLRGTTEERIRMAAAASARILDQELTHRPAIDRLEAVTQSFAEAVNAAAWAISFAPAGTGQIRSISTADDRDSRLRGLRVGLEQEVYFLEDFPSTARVVDAGSGSFLITRSDPGADDAERNLVAAMGHEAVLGVSAADLDGTYLVELYADRSSAPLRLAELDLRLLARAAIPPRPAGQSASARLLRRARQLELASKLSARLAGATDREEIISAAVEELTTSLGYGLCAVVRLSDYGMLEVVAHSLGGDAPLWKAPLTHGLIGRCVLDGQVLLSNDVRLEPAYLSTEATKDTLAELDAPIRVGNRIWGAISVQETAVDAFDDDDIRLLSMIADQAGAALRSVALYEQLDRAYLGTAEALSAALEAKDLYTAAHSRSIVKNAEAVGRLLGIPENQIRVLRLAAAFHDIGKLAIPEFILNKRGPLTEEERELIECHPRVGEQILAPVEFLRPILPLVRHAHERWDGNGYPDRLKGEEIPLGARIIFACDAWDAMTSQRPYRPPMPQSAARAEMRRNAGRQFDPRVVEALMRVLA